jgi:hypothetical protein
MKTTRGFAPIFIILAIVLIGGATYAVVNRAVLKSFFETGDKPTEAQFSDTIDSALNMTDDGDAAVAGKKEYTPTKEYTAGDTVVKSEPIYQAKVLSETQKEFKLDAVQPVTFRWTPIVPKPQEPVTYRLKVWQLMQGQNGSTAMKTNQPIVTKDVDNLTEATVSGIYTGPCRPPYLCDYVWSVEIVTKADTSAGSATGAVDESSTGAR